MEIREIGMVYMTNINLPTYPLAGYIHPTGAKKELLQDNRILRQKLLSCKHNTGQNSLECGFQGIVEFLVLIIRGSEGLFRTL